MKKINVVQGDITRAQVDAIVNAANTTLMGGGGVDGAIHRAAGPGLYLACRKFNGCPTGEARITSGFNLPARYIIHTPGMAGMATSGSCWPIPTATVCAWQRSTGAGVLLSHQSAPESMPFRLILPHQLL